MGSNAATIAHPVKLAELPRGRVRVKGLSREVAIDGFPAEGERLKSTKRD